MNGRLNSDTMGRKSLRIVDFEAALTRSWDKTASLTGSLLVDDLRQAF